MSRLPGRDTMLYIAAAVIVWLLVTLFTASSVMANYSPGRALSLNPFNATVKARIANDLVYATGDARQIGAAAKLSREALDGNPTLAGAYRMIGLDNARTGKPVRPAILAATYLTRRDYVANLWLIEDAVKRGRMDQAMTDVDASLRTSLRGQALLFPILGKAIAEPEMKPQFVRLFRASPDWLPNFLSYYIGSKQKAAPLAQVILPIRKDLPASYDQLDRTLIGMMVVQHDFDAARAYERSIAGPGTKGGASIVHNSRFEEEGPYPPIDWHLIRESAYGSDIEKGPKANRLLVVSDEERPNLVARQLVQLTPGTYRLATRGKLLTGNDDASAVWRVACAEPGKSGELANIK
ncbi:hypothetical protein, partial [Sphingopyxis sp. KK2]|uniref:hypothetical protein n=1 Tax=Sphingopyxis sp. KK2 TaxID=1855727 RepID=UPI001181A86F